jgi:uncharacterized protein with PIN domain
MMEIIFSTSLIIKIHISFNAVQSFQNAPITMNKMYLLIKYICRSIYIRTNNIMNKIWRTVNKVKMNGKLHTSCCLTCKTTLKINATFTKNMLQINLSIKQRLLDCQVLL